MLAIADDVWHLPLTPRDGINAYLIGDVLVDTGIKQSADGSPACSRAADLRDRADPRARLTMRARCKRLAERFGVPVWCGARDREAAETGRSSSPRPSGGRA